MSHRFTKNIVKFASKFYRPQACEKMRRFFLHLNSTFITKIFDIKRKKKNITNFLRREEKPYILGLVYLVYLFGHLHIFLCFFFVTFERTNFSKSSFGIVGI